MCRVRTRYTDTARHGTPAPTTGDGRFPEPPGIALICPPRAASLTTVVLDEADEMLRENEELASYLALVEDVAEESGRDMTEVAAAAARLACSDKPLTDPSESEDGARSAPGGKPVSAAPEFEEVAVSAAGMSKLCIEAGYGADVGPGDIVGAIANETGIPAKVIGNIDIYDDFSFVDVPVQYRDQVIAGMQGATIRNREANVRPATTGDVAPPGPHRKGEGSMFSKKRHVRKEKKKGPPRRK